MEKYKPAWGILFLLGVVLIYLPGLKGPLLYDDFNNLRPVDEYVAGKITFSDVIDSSSGPLGRPVSMATLVANRTALGPSPYFFKVVNLALHLLCGILVFYFLREWKFADHPNVALVLAALWLVLPIHVSTVLYVVQRMAQLSAIFMLATLICWLRFRDGLALKKGLGTAMAGAGVVAFSALAMLSKENAAVLVLLVPIVEWLKAPYRPSLSPGTARLINAMLLLGLLLVAGVCLWAIQSNWMVDAYAGRPFTMEERMLTQLRVLWDYVGAILIPAAPELGLFIDDFEISTGLTQPISTLVSGIGWIIAGAISYGLRHRSPLLLSGLLFFLGAHALESSFVPIILSFEHRNYLASIGVLLWIAGCARLVTTPSVDRLTYPLVGMVVLTLSFSTFTQATTWKSESAIYRQALIHHPNSPRLRGILAHNALENGDFEAALEHIEVLGDAYPPAEAMTAVLWKAIGQCNLQSGKTVFTAAEMEPLTASPFTTLGRNVLARMIELLYAGKCDALDIVAFLGYASQWLGHTEVHYPSIDTYQYRVGLARVHARYGQLDAALEEMQEVLEAEMMPFADAEFLLALYEDLGHAEKAARWSEEITRRYPDTTNR